MLMGQCSHMLKPGKERARSIPVNHRDEDERGFGTSLEVRLIKATVFPVVMYGCESWTVKKAEHRRTDAFELWCWRRLWC